MRNSGKRLPVLLGCILLTLSIAVTAWAAPTENCPGSCSHTAAIGTTHYDLLADALADATDGCTVTVLADQDIPALTLDKAITLDLGGKTLTGQNLEVEAMLSATKDITVENGTLSAPKGSVLAASDCAVVLDKTVSITATNGNAIEMRGSGKLTITGGTYSAKMHTLVVSPAEGKTIEVSVTGGTFNDVPTQYIPAHCRVKDNGDGTYTVIAQANVTYDPNSGTGTMTGGKLDVGTTLTLPSCTLTAPAGKHFAGWEVNGSTYAPGATLTLSGDLNLKALWASHYGGTATCAAAAKCSVCGTSYGTTSSHKLTVSAGTAATCTEKGMNSHSRCSTCGQYFVGGIAIKASSLTIPALGHEMKTVEGIEATCTQDGMLAHEACAHCGALEIDGQAVTQEQLILPATGHEAEPVAAVEATCTQTGCKAHQRCTGCDTLFENGKEVTADQLTVPVNTHLLSDWQSDSTTHWKACTGCGEVFRQHSHSDTDADSACDDCGYVIAASTEMTPTEEEGKTTSPFLIPVIIVIIITVGGTVMLTAKKRKQ